MGLFAAVLAACVVSSFGAMDDYKVIKGQHHSAGNRIDLKRENGVSGLSECQELCDAAAECVSFILEPSVNDCWLQSEIRGTEFLDMVEYDQYVRKGACMDESVDMDSRIKEVGGSDEWAQIVEGEFDCQGSCTVADSKSVCA